MITNFTDALNAFQSALGQENVNTDSSLLQEYQTATFETKNSILAIVRPNNTQEVQQCLKIANQFNLERSL